jgi:hypothetical protein
VLALQPREHRPEQQRGQQEGHRHGDRAFEPVGRALQALAHRLGVGQQLARVLVELQAGRRGRDAHVRALEEPGAQLDLQLLDLRGQRRLGHVQRAGRARKAARLEDGDEVAKGSEFHGRAIVLLCVAAPAFHEAAPGTFCSQ